MSHSRCVRYAVPLLLLVLVGVPVSAALSLNGITPGTGLNNGTVFITNLSGTDFPMDATVLLNRSGYPDIPGMYVTVADPTRITCVMDLTGKRYGPWDVVVNDPTNVTRAVLPNGFTIVNPPPYLYGIVPASGINTGSVGASISGANFFSPSVNLTNVTYGTIVGTGVSGNATDIVCTFDLNGRNEGLYDLVLTNADGQSVTLPNAFRVTYPPPVITSITPSSGINNGVIGITDLAGANFMTGATVTLVKTGETPIATINGPIVQPNKILCFFDLTGQPVGVWDVVVDNPDGQNGTLPGAFTIYYPQAPVVTGITPSTGVNDGPIVIPDISGTGFENNLTVTLTMTGQPDIPGTDVIRMSGTQVNATFDLTGVATGAWDVVVTNNDGQSGTLPAAFTVTNPPPTLVSITPDTGVNTGPVVVTDLEGTGFVTGATVTLTRTGEPDIVATGVTVVNSTTITCTLDITNAAAGLWNVTVENTDAQSATLVDGFNITNPAPTVTMLTPSEGVNTAPVYISDLAGTGFLPGATAKLSMTGQPDIVATGLTVVDPTSITCTFDITGVATGSWDVTVENPDGLTGTLPNGFNVTNPAPTVTGIDPAYGTNDGLVPILNLSGTGFLPGITAKLTKTGESDIVGQGLVVTSTKIICFFDLTGAKVGPWDVVVENTDGKSATLPDGFIVYYPQAPSITSITPDQGITFQTVSITDLAGSGFEPGVTVNLTKAGEPTIVATNVTRVSGSQITCDLDLTGAVVGPWTVVVTNDDDQLGTLNDGFLVVYPAPTVTSITPPTGINNGPVFITDLAGTAFRNGATVTLEKTNQSDITATNVTVVHRGKITCTFNLAGAMTGPWDVVVRNDDGQSGTLPNGFTVQNPAPTVTSISPNKGPNDRSVDIGSLQGTGFLPGATVKLTRTGQPDIVASGVTVQSANLINCTVDLSGAMTGLWNVVVTNTDGKSGSLPNGFTITPPPPVAAFTGNPTLGTVPLTVQFTDDSLNGPTVWVWDFGDGTLAGIYEQNPIHTYNAPGVYNVTLTVFNAGGSDTLTKYDYITVVTRPIANFTAAPTDGTAPLLVHFTDTSDGNPTKWTWKFGDGSFSIQQNPYHLYTKAGVYNVSLTVLNPAGTDTLTKYGLITVRSLPVAAFTANTTAGMSPLAVQFLDQSTGDPTNWTWSFGDGGMSTEQNPVHVYTQAGTYSVQLIAANPSGLSTETKNRYINVQEGLQAAFTYTTSNPDNTAPLSVAFIDMSTDRPIRWTWQFGDGTISTSRNPIHNYPVAGNYTVTLTVTGLSGTSATSKTIVVTSPLAAHFTAMPERGTVPLTVRFTDNTIGEPERWFWIFGDGQFQEVTNPAEKNVVHTYNTPGNFTVSLTVTGADRTDTASRVIEVINPAPVPPQPLDPHSIPKWVNQIDGPPPVYVPGEDGKYDVTMSSFTQQILPSPLPASEVWGYGGQTKDAVTGQSLGFISNSPGPTFEAEKGSPITVKWENQITEPHLFAVDPTIHWANPNQMAHPLPPFNLYPPGYEQAQYPVPLVTHLHGAEVQSTSDGGPEQWFTSTGIHGMDYRTEEPTDLNSAVYVYPDSQQPTTLWYHDHALGITRINVMSGLAGFYLLRDEADPVGAILPQGKYEVPLAIQDRTFLTDGSIFFPSEGNVPDVHPYWNPEFFGDTIMVNGKVWPNMNVDRAAYRFRLLDGSNARFYTLSLSNGMNFTQIGSDGGYLKTAAELSELTIAPGERADILIDFSNLAPGTTVVLTNNARTPYPSGDPVDPTTTGQIIQFTVTANAGPGMPVLPAELNPTLTGSFPNLPSPVNTRILTLQEVVDPGDNPLEILLDGQKWMAPVSELPVQGTTEEWMIVNPTMDTHPIHLHLVQFQLVSRQAFNVDAYQTDWIALNGEPPLSHPTINVPNLTPYLQGSPSGPLPSETGWKDTVQMNPGEVTIIRIRWAQQDGNAYPFDPTTGPGYVWHCHILDHEDNEMMRPYMVAA